MALFAILLALLTTVEARIFHEREGVAATWTVLSFHACAQAVKGPIDLTQPVVSTGFPSDKYHHPTDPQELEGFSQPIPLNSTSGFEFSESPYFKQTHPVGLLTVNAQKKRVIIAYRGSVYHTEHIDNVHPGLTQVRALKKAGFYGYIHAGYSQMFESIAPSLDQEIARIAGEYKIDDQWEILVTGFSLGGAMAALSASSISHRDDIRGARVHLVMLGTPHFAYADFSRWAQRTLASAVSFEGEADFAPGFHKTFLSTRFAWHPSAWFPHIHGNTGERSAVGEQVFLSSFGHPTWSLLSHSIRHYRYAIFRELGWEFKPLFTTESPAWISHFFGDGNHFAP